MRKAVLMLAILLFAAPPLSAQQEWSPEQQEVVEWFATFNAEAWAGDLDTFLPWLHPEFTGWSYSEKTPWDFDGFAEANEEFFEAYSAIEVQAKPMTVTVLGDVAVVHSWFKEKLTGADGDIYYTGRWTLVLLKTGDGWKNLSWTWTGEEVDPEKVKKAEEKESAEG